LKNEFDKKTQKVTQDRDRSRSASNKNAEDLRTRMLKKVEDFKFKALPLDEQERILNERRLREQATAQSRQQQDPQPKKQTSKPKQTQSKGENPDSAEATQNVAAEQLGHVAAPKVLTATNASSEATQPCCCLCHQPHDNESVVFACPNSHQICTDCFAGHVKFECNRPDKLARRAAIDCPSCEYTYQPADIARHAPSAIESYMHLVSEVKVFDAMQQMRTIVNVSSAFPNCQNGSVEALVQHAIHQIRENILNLKCPHCGAAFAEIEGCLAITCSSCRKEFCGWCLTACSSKSAAYLCAGKCSGATIFPTKQQFEDHHARRKVVLIRQYIASLPADVQEALQKEFNL
jgi:hypothetical protein